MIGQLSARELASRLSGPGLSFRTGPFAFRIRSQVPQVHAGLGLLYAGYPLIPEDSFCDFSVEIVRSTGLRRAIRPQARFRFDGAFPFEALPLAHAFPMLEWAMNWCISSHVNQFLLIHAAVVERQGLAVILPAPPGSGKSTLCAALVLRGWRLLSDEIALIPFDGGGLRALGRAISLKNESINIISAFEPSAVLNAPTFNTAKGTVTHLRVPQAHVDRLDETARPAWLVFPRWVAGSPALMTPREKSDSVVDLARNSFNYGVLGRLGFETLSDLVAACDCHDFVYGQLDDAIAAFDALAAGRS